MSDISKQSAFDDNILVATLWSVGANFTAQSIVAAIVAVFLAVDSYEMYTGNVWASIGLAIDIVFLVSYVSDRGWLRLPKRNEAVYSIGFGLYTAWVLLILLVIAGIVVDFTAALLLEKALSIDSAVLYVTNQVLAAFGLIAMVTVLVGRFYRPKSVT